jgi:hypothetical protein
MPGEVGVTISIAVVVSVVVAAVVAAVLFLPAGVGRSGPGRVGATVSKGVAVATYGAVAGVRSGGDEPPVLVRDPAAGRVLNGGPVRRQQAEQGKQQASHAIHLHVGAS